jgi:hypothetical protein
MRWGFEPRSAEPYRGYASGSFKHDRWGASTMSRRDATQDQIDFSEGSNLVFRDGMARYSTTSGVFAVRRDTHG